MTTDLTHRERARLVGLAFSALATLVTSAHLLTACSSESNAGGTSTDPPDAAVDGPVLTQNACRRTDDCEAHNRICVFAPGAEVGSCEVPPESGRCAPSGNDGVDNPRCYPGARCQPVEMAQSPIGGLCSFQAPQAPVFTFDTEPPKISATAPGVLTALRPTDGVQLRWAPPAIPADAITVAAIFTNVPQRVSGTNRIANPQDLLWIWSSTDPGASTRPGTVALESGHRGVTTNGEMGPRFGTNQLAAGRYWWFVYAIRNGAVIVTSDVLPFRVGNDFTSIACADVNTCTRMIPGELPDTVACIAGRCRRRCASDLDCPGVAVRCEFETLVEGNNVRRGAYCSVR